MSTNSDGSADLGSSWYGLAMKYFVVDAFASRAFGGNPAAVVPVERELADEVMQAIAAEFNLGETAFPMRRADGRWDLRWFTPMQEVALCGHATLGAAHALFEAGLVRDGGIEFVTRRSGVLTCVRREGGMIQMDFPATRAEAAELPQDAAEVLGVEGAVRCVGTTVMNLTLRLAARREVERCKPDFARLAEWHPIGVTVTAAGEEARVDFVSRFFAPRVGIAEDPVTGSAHCTLGPYWATELGKTKMTARQLSRRGGELGVEVEGERVKLLGHAVTTMRGVLTAI